MNYEPYEDLVALPDLSVFQFISEGPWGRITKQIHFTLLCKPGVYMLQLGDLMADGEFNRSVISNNGDWDRVLATVIQAMEVYTERYPGRSIRIWSLSMERSRLFRIAIGSNRRQLSTRFTIQPMLGGGFLFFRKNKNRVRFELSRQRSCDHGMSTLLSIHSILFKRAVTVTLEEDLKGGFYASGKSLLIVVPVNRGESRDSRRIKKAGPGRPAYVIGE